jgi:agmatinase
MSQQSALEYVRHGQTPFFRLPMADVMRGGSAAYAGADVVLLGVPYDAGCTYQPGGRLAPYHVRRVSALVQSTHPFTQRDVFASVKALDGGNCVAPPFSAPAMRELVAMEVGNVFEAGARPFVVGGDHSITLPVLRAAHRAHGPLALVHVDAHFDTSGPEVWGEEHHHGTFVKNAMDEGLIERAQLHQVGLRCTWKGTDERDPSMAHGAEIYAMDVVEDRGIAAIARRIVELVGERPTYLSFDVDAIDPAFAPGTGTPVPGGLSSREALRLVRSLAGVRLVGMDVVEVNPLLDHADLTSHLAAHLLFEGLGLVAAR